MATPRFQVGALKKLLVIKFCCDISRVLCVSQSAHIVDTA